MAKKWVARYFGSFDGLEEVEIELPPPGPGEVAIEVRAAGMNPTDYKRVLSGQDGVLPAPIGFEVAGVISAIGPETQIALGGAAVGDRVMAYKISGGYASAIISEASNVFRMPDDLDFAEAANLLLVGTTAADMLRVVSVSIGDVVLIHGASSAVGVSLLQQLRPFGVTAIGTASERNFGLVRKFGGDPIAYGDGLESRLRSIAPDGFAAVFDTVGTDEAVDVSLALLTDVSRIVSIAAWDRTNEGFQTVTAADPVCMAFRNDVRSRIVTLAADGRLVVPIAATYPFSHLREAFDRLAGEHPRGKLALIP